MENWKIVKFCETASLAELRAKAEELQQAIQSGQVANTNAKAVLALVQEYIALKVMFED